MGFEVIENYANIISGKTGGCTVIKKGKGEIIKCPNCKSEDLQETDTDIIALNQESKSILCENCGSEMSELWICKNWKLETIGDMNKN